jgi:hypothetical protein
MKYVGWGFCIGIAILSMWLISESIREASVKGGRVIKIETIETAQGKSVFVTIEGFFNNRERRLEFDSSFPIKVGQEVRVEDPKRIDPKIVIEKNQPGPMRDDDGWPIEEKKE